MNRLQRIALTAAFFLAIAGSAQAHVTIRNLANGLDSMSGKSDHFRLNVPTNRGKAVTEVKLIMADEVKLLFIHPVPGWQYVTTKDDTGRIMSVTYQGRMEAGEFTAFPFIALNPPKGDTVVKYKAYVKYEDDVVVPFDGSPEAKGYQPSILIK